MLIYIFKFVGTKDNTKRCNLREKISNYMDRAENIKKYVEQEKEGKEAVLENICEQLRSSIHPVFLAPALWSSVWSGPVVPGSLQDLICISTPI